MPNAIAFGRSDANTSLQRTTNLPPSASFTAMCWAMWTLNFTAYRTLFSLWQDASHLYDLMGYPSGSASSYLELYNGATEYTPSLNLTTNVWYHCAMVCSATSGSNLKMYLNGVLNGTGTTAISMTPTTLYIGSDGNGARHFTGLISAIKIYNRVLTAGEIAAEMPFAMPVSWDGLNSCYPVASPLERLRYGQQIRALPRGVATRFPDASGWQNDWTTESGAIDTETGPPIQFALPFDAAYLRGDSALVAAAVAGYADRRIVGGTGPSISPQTPRIYGLGPALQGGVF